MGRMESEEQQLVMLTRDISGYGSVNMLPKEYSRCSQFRKAWNLLQSWSQPDLVLLASWNEDNRIRGLPRLGSSASSIAFEEAGVKLRALLLIFSEFPEIARSASSGSLSPLTLVLRRLAEELRAVFSSPFLVSKQLGLPKSLTEVRAPHGSR